MTGELVLFDAMCLAVEAAHSLDEVLPIRDRAAQIAAAAKIAKNFEAERQCREIRVRAERRAGELLAQIEKVAGPGPGRGKKGPHDAEAFPKRQALEDIGVSSQQASEWERLAEVPKDEFETTLRISAAPSARTIIADHVALHSTPASTGGPTATETRVLPKVPRSTSMLELLKLDIAATKRHLEDAMGAAKKLKHEMSRAEVNAIAHAFFGIDGLALTATEEMMKELKARGDAN